MFIPQNKFVEIRNAAKEGNKKAEMVLQAMRKSAPQEDIDRLVEDYYKVDTFVPEQESDDMDTIIDNMLNAQGQEPAQDVAIEQPSEQVPPVLNPEITNNVENQGEVLDLTAILDRETDGLFDEVEIEDYSFNDFLKNKKKDTLRAKKNADYFKSFDLEGRGNYMQNKINAYKDKFNDRFADNNRKYNDIGLSLDLYSTKANDMLDDDIELNVDTAAQAYGDFIDNEHMMKSFGRHWDEEDSNAIMGEIEELMQKYGKKNVIAALNNLKADNEGYKKYLDNQLDTEIGRYSKSVESLLK